MAPQVVRRIARIALGQAGVVTREQAITAGASPRTIARLVEHGVWIVLHRGVYAVASSAATWHRRVFAALLAAGEGAVLCGEAAAYEWGLVDRAPQIIDVTVPDRRRLQLDGVRIRRLNLHREDATYRGRVRILTVARTIPDLAALLEPDDVEDIVVDAIRRWPRALSQMSRCLDRMPTAPGTADLRKFTRLLDPDVLAQLMSKFESRALAMFLRTDVPQPHVNRMLYDPTGALVAKIEFTWQDGRVVMECDGLRFHTTPSQTSYDDRRQNRLVLEGRVVLRYGWRDLEDPQRVVRDVRRALQLGAAIAGSVPPG